MAPSRDVLVVGFDPRAVPGVDPDAVETALAVGRERLAQHGLNADECLAALDDTFEATVVEQLTRKPYGCVVVGGGLRKPEALLELFERVVNLIRMHAPQAAIAFNSDPTDSAEAALRWLGDGQGADDARP